MRALVLCVQLMVGCLVLHLQCSETQLVVVIYVASLSFLAAQAMLIALRTRGLIS